MATRSDAARFPHAGIHAFFMVPEAIPNRFLMRGRGINDRRIKVGPPSRPPARSKLMNLLSLTFWALVAVTLLISVRWGAMIGLIVFVFALMFGAVAVSRFAPPRLGSTPAVSLLTGEAERPPMPGKAFAVR